MDKDITIPMLIGLAKKGAGLLLGKKGTVIDLARLVGVDRSSIYKWLNGETVPYRGGHYNKLESLAIFYMKFYEARKKIAEQFDVSV
jgi:transcriptional regulator with XRE-family HTH domain